MIPTLVSWLTANPDKANAIAAVANVVVAFLALLVAAISIAVSRAALRGQLLHNKLSVRPIAWVGTGNYEHRLSVKIWNNGTGPLIIKQVIVSSKGKVKNDLISWMPEGIFWTDYQIPWPKRPIEPGGHLVLLELAGDANEPAFVTDRDRCRAALKDLTVKVLYTDIYNDEFIASRKLDWFGEMSA